MKHGLCKPGLDDPARHVARACDRIIGLTGDFQTVKYARHRIPRTRRIGDQDRGAAAGPKPHQRVAGCGKSLDAIVHDTPDIAEHDVVVARERFEMFDEIGHGRNDQLCLVPTRANGISSAAGSAAGEWAGAAGCCTS